MKTRKRTRHVIIQKRKIMCKLKPYNKLNNKKKKKKIVFKKNNVKLTISKLIYLRTMFNRLTINRLMKMLINQRN